MTRTIIAFAFGPGLGLALLGLGLAAPGWADNGKPAACVTCHAEAATRRDPKLFEYYRQWEGSAHHQAGVDCYGCHGGEAQAPEEAAAHAGMKRLTDPQEVIPTCGGCHTGQLQNFQKSKHYVRLLNREMAPDCVTCHGSRTASALSPEKVPQVCSRCHNPKTRNRPDIPEKTRQIFGLYQTVLDDLKQAQASIQAAPAENRPVEASVQKLRLAEAMLLQIKETWHSFDLDATQNLVFRTEIVANQAIVVPGLWQRIPVWIKGLGLIVILAVGAVVLLRLRKGTTNS